MSAPLAETKTRDGDGLALVVNGTAVACDVPPATRLSTVLRDGLGLTGTKVGCDAGDCGACSVLLDGEVVCACMVAAGQAQGRTVTTIEGLADDPAMQRLQNAFLDRGAAQCGICTPGMLVTAKALLAADPAPHADAIADALGGVLCRCTGYRKIIAAVLDASQGAALTAPLPGAGEAVGASIVRLDGLAKVTGADRFGADGAPAEALVLRVIRSPCHHARFAFGDIAGFVRAHPGIERVFTAADIPGRNRHGVIPPFADQPVFAEDVARFKGEAVAAVVGSAEAMATLDLAAFPVAWTPLPHVLDTEAARAPDAPLLHADRPGNLLVAGRVRRGDADAALAGAAVVVGDSFETSFVEHAYIEPEAGHAVPLADGVDVHACTQATYMDRDDLCAILDLPPSRVRVTPTAVGGGFGAKLDLSVQPYIVLAALALQRPVRMAYTRPESMASSTKRHPASIDMAIGADGDGRITAIRFAGTFNTGAYASWGPTVAARVPVHASGPYLVPHYQAEATAVHTHGPVAGAFRGFGVPQSAVALETLIDRLADRLGIDRLAIRRRNALTDGQPTVTGQVFAQGVGIDACLAALEPHWTRAVAEARAATASAGNASTGTVRRGVGVASCWYGCGNTGLPNPSTMRAGIAPDGRVVLMQGAVDIGQGSHTVVTQCFADALGVPVGAVDPVAGDTDITPDAGKTSASRQTFVSGKAAMLCGQALRDKVLRYANAGPDAGIRMEAGQLAIHEGETRRVLDLCDMPVDGYGWVLGAEATYDPPTTPLDDNGQGSPYAVFGYGAQLVELAVDIALGTVELIRITAAHDVGRAVNPALVEGQIEGGIAQGIGMALMEEYVPGRTENLHDYLIPTIGDVPEIRSIIVEVPDAEGPYGAKGLGEHVLIPTAPAILNAIRDATGVELTRLPATPDRVLAAIKARAT